MLLFRFAPPINQSLPPPGSQKSGWFPPAECICIFWLSAQGLCCSWRKKPKSGRWDLQEHQSTWWFPGRLLSSRAAHVPVLVFLCSVLLSCLWGMLPWPPGLQELCLCWSSSPEPGKLSHFLQQSCLPGNYSVVMEGGEFTQCLPYKDSLQQLWDMSRKHFPTGQWELSGSCSLPTQHLWPPARLRVESHAEAAHGRVADVRRSWNASLLPFLGAVSCVPHSCQCSAVCLLLCTLDFCWHTDLWAPWDCNLCSALGAFLPLTSVLPMLLEWDRSHQTSLCFLPDLISA